MKRAASHLVNNQQSSNPPVKRQRRPRQANRSEPFTLLKLPIDVRHLILKELLLWPEPIDFQSRLSSAKYATRNPLSDPRLHLNVLRTCRQLYEEGCSLLYHNTIKCRAWSKWPVHEPPRARQTFPYILSATYSIGEMRQLPSAVTRRISRIHVEITAGSSRRVDLIRLQCQLRAITNLMKETPSWKHLTVELNVLNVETDVLDDFLKPFLYIRGLESASIKGVSTTMATKLTSLMTSNEPVIDLDRMYAAVAPYALSVTNEDHVGHGLLESEWTKAIRFFTWTKLAKARDDDDAEAFRKQRRKLMRFVNAFIFHQQSSVLSFDPDDWKADSNLRMDVGLGTEPTEGLDQSRAMLDQLRAEIRTEAD